MGESTEPEKPDHWIPAGIKSGFMKMYAGDKGRQYQPDPRAPVAATRLMHLRIIIRSAVTDQIAWHAVRQPNLLGRFVTAGS